MPVKSESLIEILPNEAIVNLAMLVN